MIGILFAALPYCPVGVDCTPLYIVGAAVIIFVFFTTQSNFLSEKLREFFPSQEKDNAAQKEDVNLNNNPEQIFLENADTEKGEFVVRFTPGPTDAVGNETVTFWTDKDEPIGPVKAGSLFSPINLKKIFEQGVVTIQYSNKGFANKYLAEISKLKKDISNLTSENLNLKNQLRMKFKDLDTQRMLDREQRAAEKRGESVLGYTEFTRKSKKTKKDDEGDDDDQEDQD